MDKEYFKISKIRSARPFSSVIYTLSDVKTGKPIITSEGTKNAGAELSLFLITSEYFTYDKR